MSQDENSHYNYLYEPYKRQSRGKENQSLNRSSNIYSSISDKWQSFTHLKLDCGQYWGQIKNGKANGVGSCYFSKGTFYYGEWNNNQINGMGVYFFNIGGYIKGEFRGGKADGICELCYQNGQTYVGYFNEGRQNGVGFKSGRRGKEIIQYKNGQRICVMDDTPTFEDVNILLKSKLPQVYMHNDRIVYGLQCDLTGLGIMQYANGRVDFGWFQNGSLNGKGRIIFKSGDIYEGFLKNGYFQGNGCYLNYQSKQMTEGVFEKNSILEIEKQSIYEPGIYEDVVDQRIIVKNTYLKTKQIQNQIKQRSSEKKPINTNNNKIQHLFQHNIVKNSKISSNNTEKSEEVLDNLLSRVQSPQQRKNLQQIINQVTSPIR